ncbi:MAG: hypothetical protein ACM30G_08615 [Micromonosporaceae bacterium]
MADGYSHADSDRFDRAEVRVTESGGNLKWVIGAVIVPIVVACIGAGVVVFKPVCLPVICSDDRGGNGGPDSSGEASVFLNRLSGPAGTVVNVSGTGFEAGETITIRFHTEQVGETTADAGGKFTNVPITIPDSFSKFAPQQFDIIAEGKSSISTASTPFTLTG